MKYRAPLLLVLLLFALFIMPVVSAAPTILPTSSSLYAVQATDYYEFPPNTGIGVPAAYPLSWTLTAPDGSTMSFNRNPLTSPGTLTQRWSLDGTIISGESGLWSATGSLVGAPGDGTWQISVGAGNYQFADAVAAPNSPSPTLSVNARGIHFGVHGACPANQDQYWNYRSTTASTIWNEPSTVPSANIQTNCAIDTPNESAQEDPDNAVFFSTGSEYTAYTLHATVTCGASAALHTMTVNGAWIGASGATNSFWASRDGNQVGITDLRSIAGTTTTANEAEGSTGSGTDTQVLPYNSAAGTSYQFFVSTSAQGEAFGVVAYAASGQCNATDPPAGSNEHNAHALVVTASQAQCNGDATTFAITMQDNPSGLQEHLTSLFILDSNQGTLGSPPNPISVATYTTPDMHRTDLSTSAHTHYIHDVFPPGNYVAYVIADYTGVGAVNYIAAEAFSVPFGTCIWQEPDLSGVYQSLALLEGNLTEILGILDEQGAEQTELLNLIVNLIETLDIVFDCSSNCTITANLTTLEQILNEINEHRNGSLELNAMSFNGLGFDGFSFMLLFIAMFLWAGYTRQLLIMILAATAIVVGFIDAFPVGQTYFLLLALLAAAIIAIRQSWAENRAESEAA